MATETKEATIRPINRLKTMYALRAYADEMYKEGRKAEETGRPVAWAMVGVPTQILTAAGFETVFPENYGTVSASSGAAAGFLERSDADGFPTHLCGYCRNSLGYAARMVDLEGQVPPESPGAGMAKPTLLVTETNCDARIKFMQALGRYLDVPVYMIEAPHPGPREALIEGANERRIKLLVKECKQFSAFLEKLTGNKVDWDELWEKAGGKGDSGRELETLWGEINDMRREIPCPIHARDALSAMSGVFYRAADPKKIIPLYRDMYDEVKERVKNKVAGINYPERYRIAFQGLPPWHSLGFFDKLAERGWNIVHGPYHGSKPEDIDVSHISDPVECFVRTYSRWCGLEDRIDNDFEPEEAAEIKEELRRTGHSNRLGTNHIKEYRCDGAFVHPLLTCRSASCTLILAQHSMMEAYKVPSLVLPGDIVDLTLFDPVEGLKKAEAFEDTMDYYKEVRRKEGLDW